MLDPEKKESTDTPSTIVDGGNEAKPRTRRRRTAKEKKLPGPPAGPCDAECTVLGNLCIDREVIAPEYDDKGNPVRKIKIPGRHVARLKDKGVIE